jgi:hypothetical protein
LRADGQPAMRMRHRLWFLAGLGSGVVVWLTLVAG